MTQIKIISNPYKQEIEYMACEENSGEWMDIGRYAPSGKLREESARKCFLPFNAKEILAIIVEEYYLESKGPVKIIFEGTKEEYNELLRISQKDSFQNKIDMVRSKRILDNGKYILSDTKEIFANVKPVIERIACNEPEIIKNLAKVTDALDDIIPICVFGNYSAGKSTFINALIGREILPSGGDPVTAKAFKIQNSAQQDIARIRFKHWDRPVELIFEDDTYRLVKGNVEDEMLVELDTVLKEIDSPTMDILISVSLEFINEYEKKDTTSTEIGNMIELDIAFSKEGILGRSNNKFVIFDTPGSNTATNDGHIEVLKEALEDFSNGIPVWVSQYETIDTVDNEALCNNILSIDALDNRFTMIIMNKADVSDLPEAGFSEKQIKNIKEFRSVEKMYASGIYFLSSIMGLGAKRNGVFFDKFYRKIYKLQTSSFTDPEDEDYMVLYQYNIMPEQIKEQIVECSGAESNTVYVNSGLFCIETEIEEFASKYSAYNKCQMVYALLSDVVDRTTDKIDKRVQAKKALRERYKSDLGAKEQELIDTLYKTCERMDSDFSDEAYDAVNENAKNSLNYECSIEDMAQLNEKYIDENTGQYGLDEKKQNLDDAVGDVFGKLKGRIRDFSISDIKGSITGIAEDAKKGVETIYGHRKELKATQKDASTETADEVLGEVIELYKKNMLDAADKINHIAWNYWSNNAAILKEELIRIVTASDALTETQKTMLSQLIFDYENVSYEDQASIIFAKPKFLQWHLLGLDLFVFEKLNLAKLTKEYNKAVAQNIEGMATDMNISYHNIYTQWQEKLSSMLEKNIVELNPELHAISDSIDNETVQIEQLESSQQKIRFSLNEIESLISFKTVE